MANKTDIKINGMLLPPCKEEGIKIVANKLFSSNSGRSETTGDFVGDVIAVKYDVTIEWDILSEEWCNRLTNWAKSEIIEYDVEMKFDGQKTETKSCYLADLPTTVKRERNGKIYYAGVSLHIIEM